MNCVAFDLKCSSFGFYIIGGTSATSGIAITLKSIISAYLDSHKSPLRDPCALQSITYIIAISAAGRQGKGHR